MNNEKKTILNITLQSIGILTIIFLGYLCFVHPLIIIGIANKIWNPISGFMGKLGLLLLGTLLVCVPAGYMGFSWGSAKRLWTEGDTAIFEKPVINEQ